MKKHVHIMGASGSGVTTLRKNIAKELGYVHFDTDDFFWEQTEVPFTKERAVEKRIKMLKNELAQHEKWVLSGDLHQWGKEIEPYYDLVVFIYLPKEIRKERLIKRETKRYGRDSLERGKFYQKLIDFIAWAMLYDNQKTTITRTLANHTKWLEALACPYLKIEGNYSETESTAMAIVKIK